MIDAIVTVPPYAPYLRQVVNHPIVSGIRLNTVMPIQGKLEDTLKNLKSLGKDLWIDLKYRQLRVTGYWVPPFTEIELSHEIELDTTKPVTAYFSDGRQKATILRQEKNKLFMQEGPRRVIGPGESLNIKDPSLKILGGLTETDKEYLRVGKKLGIDTYMLSYVEAQKDLYDVLTYHPQAIIAEKIESRKGLQYVDSGWKGQRLMAARGDLYVELERPHQIIGAMKDIIKQDPKAIAASRIFPSLAYTLEPACEDIGDVDSLMQMGYKTFMLGDDVAMKESSVMSALNLLEEMARSYERK
ncbi:MAG: hypothetical protein KC535_02915 [Nanoarchaeota archaeon]|nr:hypothetical protein [Nanoarchaeota archaeon]